MVKCIVTFSDVILYWNAFDYEKINCEFYIYQNKKYVGKTNKTHYTIRDIEDKNVIIDIFLDSDKRQLFYHNEFIMPDKPRFIDISKEPYLAVGDGKTMNTEKIQKAIDDCGINECVYIPKGNFLTGALNLHSNMELYIEKEGALIGSVNPITYLPKVLGRSEGIEQEVYRALINVGNIRNRDECACENVMIHGGGKIVGGGYELLENVIQREREEMSVFSADEPIMNMLGTCGLGRPKLLSIGCSKNIMIDNIEFSNGAFWNVHMIYSDQITTCNCKFISHGIFNGDGWDPDSSTNCILFHCTFDTSDDCVSIKSGKNPEGNVIAKPCKDIYVFDCKCLDGHGFTIGSEMSGGIENVYIWDCDVAKTIFGIEIKATKKRGGYVKNINVKNCAASRIMLHSVGYNDNGIAAQNPPKFSECKFEKMIIRGEAREWRQTEVKPCRAIEITGFEDDYEIENIGFYDIEINNGRNSMEQIFSFQRTKGITISNISVR